MHFFKNWHFVSKLTGNTRYANSYLFGSESTNSIKMKELEQLSPKISASIRASVCRFFGGQEYDETLNITKCQ